MVTCPRSSGNSISILQRVLASLVLGLIGLGQLVSGSDPDPLQDYCVALDDPSDSVNVNVNVNGFLCKNPNEVTPNDFLSQLLRTPGDTDNKLASNVTLITAANFPALNTEGISIARIELAPKRGLNPPHIHPRASEVFFLVEGTVQVGFIDASINNSTLFSQTLYAGDLFIFPRGLVHFQLNLDDKPALGIAALNSQNPGVSRVAEALFAVNPPLPAQVLKIAFGINKTQLDEIIEGVKQTV